MSLGLSPAEVGNELGISTSSVSKLLAELRDELSGG
jgi:DNA-directed RNA polymerase specialized sigma24 family protein